MLPRKLLCAKSLGMVGLKKHPEAVYEGKQDLHWLLGGSTKNEAWHACRVSSLLCVSSLPARAYRVCNFGCARETNPITNCIHSRFDENIFWHTGLFDLSTLFSSSEASGKPCWRQRAVNLGALLGEDDETERSEKYQEIGFEARLIRQEVSEMHGAWCVCGCCRLSSGARRLQLLEEHQ